MSNRAFPHGRKLLYFSAGISRSEGGPAYSQSLIAAEAPGVAVVPSCVLTRAAEDYTSFGPAEYHHLHSLAKVRFNLS